AHIVRAPRGPELAGHRHPTCFLPPTSRGGKGVVGEGVPKMTRRRQPECAMPERMCLVVPSGLLEPGCQVEEVGRAAGRARRGLPNSFGHSGDTQDRFLSFCITERRARPCVGCCSETL